MPVYEYYCKACDHEWEREQKISDPPVKTCPKCRARQAKRLISRTSFVLKGGGWYSDLYSSSKQGASDDASAGKAGSDDASPKAAGEGGAEKKSKEKKGAAKEGGSGGKKGSGTAGDKKASSGGKAAA